MILKGPTFFHSLLILLSLRCFVVVGYGKQSDVLQSFFMKKLQNKAGMNTELLTQEKTDIFREVLADPQDGLKEQDKIEKLPGQPKVNFSQYGGYVTVNKAAGRALYYYFAEAVNKDSKPLLLWLNGGPGCSSLGYGAMTELGPFRVYSDGKSLYSNPYAWNQVANVLFLESPAGTGFSYSNTTSDYKSHGDIRTATDNYAFLVNWLERFPEYKTRDFYISGESYAGHLVPQLAHLVIQGNKAANRTIINLKGIMIGNAVINHETDQKGMYEYFWTHALISDQAYYLINRYCNFSQSLYEKSQKRQCTQGLDEVDIYSLNIYNIYGPICLSSNVTIPAKNPSVLDFDPCSANYVYAYMNRPDVQEALHANVTRLSFEWAPCSDVIIGWKDRPSTILSLLSEAMANGVRVWVFSGDVDAVVPVTSTRLSLNKLRLPVETSWYPWLLNNEVGGYTFTYKGDLTFATVIGAGHEVPSFQPAKALTLVQYFLRGEKLPSK